MISFGIRYADKLIQALIEHMELVLLTLCFALLLASFFTLLSLYWNRAGKFLLHLCSIVYSIPSLALFAFLIPVTGLGKTTAVVVLVVYAQYILLQNFITGLYEVDQAVLDAAKGMGMSKLQVIIKIQLPLARRPLFTGIRLCVITTVGIATIAAMINAGGLGSILFDGLRTMNVNKILWGSILSAGLVFILNGTLSAIEKRL